MRGCVRTWNHNDRGRVRSRHRRWQCLRLTRSAPKRSSSMRGVVGSVIACFVLLACLVIADQLFWTDQAASNQSQYEHHHWNTSGVSLQARLFLLRCWMSDPLVVSVPHSLGKAEALRRLKSGFARMTPTFPFLTFDEQTWTDDRMTFRAHAMGQFASGTVDVGENAAALRSFCRGSSAAARGSRAERFQKERPAVA